MALHTTSIIQIHQTALIQLPPLQYVRGALATVKHSLSVHRVCLHILISPPQHTNGLRGPNEVLLSVIHTIPRISIGDLYSPYVDHNLRRILGIRGRLIPHKECQESKEYHILIFNPHIHVPKRI